MATPFGKYSLQRKLAEGGMAEVFLARQAGLEGFEKLVVVKRILPALCQEQSFVQMFLNEARVAARLNHPNVVQIWDLGKIEDLYFIAMEYVHGEDLRELFRVADESRSRPSHGLICRIMADTLAGLHYAHTRISPEGKPLGLVHRDVSPQNVLVTYEGSTKLVDFGIAKATRATSEQTQAGLFKGKFAYMSPEQARGQPVDARSDVFSVGILLWELLTWSRLFKRPTEMATLIAVAEDPIASPRTIDPSVPVELEKIVLRALARPLDERYQSAQEMRADLETLIRDLRWEADAMALQRYLRELFARKLKSQENDIRAAGLASLEDFLLRVEEKTSISWMKAPDGSVKTPSVGLPASMPHVPAGAPSATPPVGVRSMYDDGAPPNPADEIPSAPTLIAPDSGPVKMPPPRPPTVQPPARSGAIQTVRLPDPPAATNATAPSGVPSLDPGSTAKRPALEAIPPRYRRVLVISTAAIVVAAIGLTILLWPQKPDAAVIDPTIASPSPSPSPSPPSPSPSPHSAGYATLVIATDARAIIMVDGKVAAPGPVQVKPGVPHTVTAQRMGHSMHTIHVPALADGERLPVTVKLK